MMQQPPLNDLPDSPVMAALDAIRQGLEPDLTGLSREEALFVVGMQTRRNRPHRQNPEPDPPDDGETSYVGRKPTAAQRKRLMDAIRARQGGASDFEARFERELLPLESTLFANQAVDIVAEDDVVVRRLTRENLKPLTITIAQALDNQFVPRRLLARVIAGHSFEEIADEVVRTVRIELRRALLMSSSVVVNRGFLYGNRAIFAHYSEGSRDREAFKKLLGSGAIIPYLFNENSPVADPSAFVPDPGGFEQWKKLCRETPTFALRLSWDPEQNRKDAHKLLAAPMTEFVNNMKNRIVPYADAAGLAQSQRVEFYRSLKDIADQSDELVNQRMLAALEAGQEPLVGVNREFLYERFITNDKPHKRQYRTRDPIAMAVKQVIDLAYNAFLPDALGGYLLTPQDSLPRSSLQELHYAIPQERRIPLDDEQIALLFQRAAFERVATRTESHVASLESLTLDDVNLARETPEWATYMADLGALLENPLGDSLLARVVDSYARLARVVTTIALEQRRTTPDALDPWSANPTIEATLGTVRIVARHFEDRRIFYIDDPGQAFPATSIPVATALTVGDRGNEIGDLDARIEMISGMTRMPSVPRIATYLKDQGFIQVYSYPTRESLREHYNEPAVN